MPVKMRLQRHGKKRKPFYHIVIADARAPRDGKFIERIGFYNPNTDPATIEINREVAADWLNKGAQPTNTVRAILSYTGVMYRKHLQRGVAKGAFSQEVADQKFDEWWEEKAKKVENKKIGIIQAQKAVLSKQDEAEKTARLAREEEARKALAAAQEAEKPAEEAAAEPVADAPAEEPKAEVPVEKPAVAETPGEAPAAEEPKVEEPKAEEPKAEEPKAEEPKAEEPKAEEPKEEAPVAETMGVAAAGTVVANEVAKATGDDAAADDLTKIEGIGPKIAETLGNAGIKTFAQLAEAPAEKVTEILTEASLSMHDPGTWGRQAQMAADGKWDELKTWQDELDGGKEA